MKIKHGYLLVSLLLLLAGCSDNGKLLRASEFGADWPLTVDECHVNCVGEYAVIITVDGKKYAVNDAAREMEQFEDVDQITRINPNYPGQQVKMKLSDIEFEGLKICP